MITRYFSQRLAAPCLVNILLNTACQHLIAKHCMMTTYELSCCSDLSGRTLEGAIPATGWQLPASLEGLNLNNNAIRSVLPATWQLPALRRLELGGNKLHGPIPATLSLPPQLKHLQLCCNELSGTLPASLALPTTLFELDLDNNMLSGSVPAEWQLPSGLFLLNLQQNALQGGRCECC